MKKLINNLLKTAFVVSMMFVGSLFADAASFDGNPSGVTGIVSVKAGTCDSCGGQSDTAYISIPNAGDSEYINVFADYMAQRNSSQTVNSASVTYNIKNLSNQTAGSLTFRGTLSAANANPISDTTIVVINGADNYKVEFIGGHVEDTHHTTDSDVCIPAYDYNVSFGAGESALFSGGKWIGDLDNVGGSWCAQGTLVARYKITNTEVTNSYHWDPNDNTSGWGEWSAWGVCSFAGQIVTRTRTRTVVCRDQNNNLASNSSCTGSMPATSQTESQNCGGDNNNYVWVWGQWSQPNSSGVCSRTQVCYLGSQEVSNTYCSGNPAVDYDTNCGGDDDGNHPEAQTNNESSVTSSSARLRGEIKMYSVNDGKVFFVYGKDESDIQDVDAYFDTYNDIDTYGVRKVVVDYSNDADLWKNFSKSVSGLSTDERYYYRMCVEYYMNGTDDITCGGVEDFRTEDGGGNNVSDIETRNPDSISRTTAKICGNLNDDGGNTNLLTWLEYKKSTASSYMSTSHIDRGEGYYCETVRGLQSNTLYVYRACSADGCASTRTFKTSGDIVIGDEKPIVITDKVYSVQSHSAVLPGTYVSNADRATVYFRYGRDENLTKETLRYTKYGVGGSYTHNFTNLKANQRYCYQAVITTVNGSDSGSVRCFVTAPAVVTPTRPTRPTTRPVEPVYVPVVETIVEDTTPDIDLSRLGLGLSLIRLDITDEQDSVTKGESVTYTVTWENISEIDLDELDLQVKIPREVQITSSSRGRLDQDRNAIVYTINRLDAGEKNSMTVTGIVSNGSLGDALTADATIAFDNPINNAKENATDYDVDEFTVLTALGTASVFGLGNITLLGWLTILLGLFIVFLVARWLYLEREELRAQAYVNGYGRQTPYMMAPTNNHNGYIAPTATPQYVEPMHAAPVDVTPTPAPAQVQSVNPQQGERPDYRPYRPNR